MRFNLHLLSHHLCKSLNIRVYFLQYMTPKLPQTFHFYSLLQISFLEDNLYTFLDNNATVNRAQTPMFVEYDIILIELGFK